MARTDFRATGLHPSRKPCCITTTSSCITTRNCPSEYYCSSTRLDRVCCCCSAVCLYLHCAVWISGDFSYFVLRVILCVLSTLRMNAKVCIRRLGRHVRACYAYLFPSSLWASSCIATNFDPLAFRRHRGCRLGGDSVREIATPPLSPSRDPGCSAFSLRRHGPPVTFTNHLRVFLSSSVDKHIGYCEGSLSNSPGATLSAPLHWWRIYG